MTAVAQTLFETGAWHVRGRSDRAALALARDHYSRQTPDAPWLGPPGRTLTLVTPCELAVWQTSWPEHAYTADGLDCYRCTIFHREPGAELASDLIRAAVELTERLWGPCPADGWVTWIDTRKVASSHPGYCFKQAGWHLDREYRPWRKGLIRLRLRSAA